MLDKVLKWGPFVSAPLSFWRFVNLGATVPDGIAIPELPELADDDPTPPPFIERNNETVTIHFHDVARFRLDFAERSITGFDIDPETAECVLVHILYDHIAPRLMAELGALVLHASAVQIGDAVALFLGVTGTGKSTLATSLHQAGHSLLGDDAVIVTRADTKFLAKAVYPSLRLFPEAIARLLDRTVPTAPMADYSDKLNVRLPGISDSRAAPMPISAIFFLSGEFGASIAAATPLDSTRTCIKLVEQSFTLDPRDPRCAARRLAAASELALAVPAYILSYPHDFARLREARAVIEAIMEKSVPDMQVTGQRNLVQ